MPVTRSKAGSRFYRISPKTALLTGLTGLLSCQALLYEWLDEHK